MIGQPPAEVILRGPRGGTGAVGRELVLQVDLRAHQAAHAILGGSHESSGDVAYAACSGIRIAQEIIGAIPIGGVFSGGKRGLAQEVSHATPLLVLDDQGDVAGCLQGEGNADGRRLHGTHQL